MPTLITYVQFLAAFITAQSISMWGQFYTLKYPNLGMFQALLMALPFAWLDWFFMTIAIGLGHKYKLVSETQDIFLLIITQFTVILLMNRYFLHQPLHRSDIAAFGIILIAFAVSYMNLVSKTFGWAVPKKQEEVEYTAGNINEIQQNGTPV